MTAVKFPCSFFKHLKGYLPYRGVLVCVAQRRILGDRLQQLVEVLRLSRCITFYTEIELCVNI